MAKFAVRCIQPVTGKPYTLAIEAPSFEDAARAASAGHTVDPADLPPVPIYTTTDPADFYIRVMVWCVIGCLGLLLVLMTIGVVMQAFEGE